MTLLLDRQNMTGSDMIWFETGRHGEWKETSSLKSDDIVLLKKPKDELHSACLYIVLKNVCFQFLYIIMDTIIRELFQTN